MLKWLKNKNQLQKLQSKYCKLMKSSYNLAVTDKQKSDYINTEAHKILIEIKKLEHTSK